MGLSSSIFNDNRFYCYNRSESIENLQSSNQYSVKMQRIGGGAGLMRLDNIESSKQRKSQDQTNKDKGAILSNPSISCISQIPSKGILKLQNLKKKVSKFKKKINSNSVDYGKMFYDFISPWSHKELQALKHEYDALGILRELDKQTNDSRPLVSSLMHDLDGLFKTGVFSDTEISFKGEHFKVHRALLSVRSVFFRQCFHSWKAQPDIMLSSYNSNSSVSCGSCQHHNRHYKKPIPIHLDNPSVTPDVFRSILQYIYTEQLDIDEDQIDNWDMIYLLREKFHLPNRLQFDMKRLFEDTSDTDCILVFSQSSDFLSLDFSPFSTESINKDSLLLNFIRHFHFNTANNIGDQYTDETGVDYDNNFLYNVSYELPCHRSILAARSGFFKRIIEIKLRDQITDNNDSQINSQKFNSKSNFESIINAPMRITIEESIISHRYARVLLYCLYTGQLNMQLIVTKHYSDKRSPTLDLTASLKVQPTSHPARFQSPLTSASSSEHPSAAGLYIHTFLPSCINCIRDVMQLYQIGSYMEFKLLCHNCEDLLVKNITLDNVIEMLRWSSEPFGSAFVRRHIISWMRDEFHQIIHSPFLPELLKSELIEIISSQFTQAPEAEILNGIIKWAESQLELPITPKESSKDSNIVLMLKDLYSKRNQAKNKHLNDPALAKLIYDLLQYVNFNHFFPGSETVKISLIRRGVIQGIPNVAADITDPFNLMKAKQSWCRMINSREIRTEIFMSPHIDTKYNILSLDLPQSQFEYNKQQMSFKGPRLVNIFYEQLKMVLAERSRSTKPLKCFDDTALHEMESIRPPGRIQPILIPPSQSQFPLLSMQHICSSEPLGTLSKRPKQHSYLNCRITSAIHKRVKDLQSGVIVQRALFMPCVSWTAVFHLLRLQSLREYGLPDHLLSEIFNEKLIQSSYDKQMNTCPSNNTDNMPHRLITPIPIIRSFTHLNSTVDNYQSHSLRGKYRTNNRKSKESLESSKCLSYYQSNNTISDSSTPEIERQNNSRSCRCKENKSAIYNKTNYELNVMTILSQTDSNLNKNISTTTRKSRNSYPTSPSVLLLPSALELQSDIIDQNSSSSRHRAKHKVFDKWQDMQYSSRTHSFKVYKDDTIRSLNVEHNRFITSGYLDSDNDLNNDDTNNSYNPWVFNAFNFKTNKTDLLDNELKLQHGSNDSARIFFGESPKTHSPLYGVKKQYHHSMCLACNNMSHSSFHLNYLSRSELESRSYLGASDNSSKEVEL